MSIKYGYRRYYGNLIKIDIKKVLKKSKVPNVYKYNICMLGPSKYLYNS